MNRADRVTRLCVRFAAGSFLALLAATAGLRLTYNTSASLPRGIYRIQPLERPPRRGEAVGVCLTRGAARLALARGYVHPEGLEPYIYGVRCGARIAVIGKTVAGVPGDVVEVSPAGVRVNGVRVPHGTITPRDHRGRPVPHAVFGRRTLGEGEYWVQSPYAAASFDSRVFGTVGREQIVDLRVPVITLNDSPVGGPVR